MSAGPSIMGGSPLVSFTRSDHERLRASLRELHDLIDVCDRAEQCGIDVAHYRRLRDQLTEVLGKIELHFMTPPPTA